MPAGDDYQYFLSLKSVRDQAYKVYNAAVAGSLVNFEFHEKKLDGAADYVVETILVRNLFSVECVARELTRR